jgi:pyridoxine 4-dehydrogenase
MTDITPAGTFRLGDRDVHRMGYGAMQLAGPGVFGPPRDHDQALAVLRAAVGSGVDHIDTSDFYGPYVVNRLIREAWPVYPANLTIVTKIGAKRGEDASWLPALSPDELERAVHDNLEHLGIEAIDVANYRIMGAIHAPSEGSIAKEFGVLAKLREQGLIRHLGISNATAAQVREAQGIAPIVCVQNMYNIVHRADDALVDDLAAQGIAYVPFFPLGGFSPVQSERLNEIAAALSATPLQVALAWLLQRSPNILLIPGTSSLGHLKENLEAASLRLSAETVAALDAIGG